MRDILELQREFMEQHGFVENPQPGLTGETRLWEDQIKQDFYHLQVASLSLHQTMSADAVAAILLESVCMMQSLVGLLTNIGVHTKIEQAFTQILAAQEAGAQRPNLLPLVLDRE